MLTIHGTNVNTILPVAMVHLRENGRYVCSRGMETIEYPGPVASVYLRPRERVLFSPVRDANPFFHFFESLWILAGRDDVAWISRFNSNIHRYSDNGLSFRGAYGARMREYGGATYIDQLETVIKLLKEEPDTRRAVISLWDPMKDLRVSSVDVPCNNLLYFKIREGNLNLTVCNRSNDAIWGCYGANVVQFSFIQEYVASMLGVGIGPYVQMSDSLHVYTDNPLWEKLRGSGTWARDPYEDDSISICPLVSDKDKFMLDLTTFMLSTSSDRWLSTTFRNRIFNEVAVPLWNMWKARKVGDDWKNHFERAADKSNDWLVAAKEWCERRQSNKVGV